MSKKKSVQFKIGFTHYAADAVVSVVQRDESTVVVRYSDGRSPVTIEGTTTSQVLAAIERAKADADSA